MPLSHSRWVSCCRLKHRCNDSASCCAVDDRCVSLASSVRMLLQALQACGVPLAAVLGQVRSRAGPGTALQAYTARRSIARHVTSHCRLQDTQKPTKKHVVVSNAHQCASRGCVACASWARAVCLQGLLQGVQCVGGPQAHVAATACKVCTKTFVCASQRAHSSLPSLALYIQVAALSCSSAMGSVCTTNRAAARCRAAASFKLVLCAVVWLLSRWRAGHPAVQLYL